MGRGGYRPGAGRPASYTPAEAEALIAAKDDGERAAVKAHRDARLATLRAMKARSGPHLVSDNTEAMQRKETQSNMLAALAAWGNAAKAPQPDRSAVNPFKLPEFPEAAIPKDKAHRMALDSACEWAANQWANGGWGWAGSLAQAGLAFPGYTALSELSQRPEYRTMAETIATEMTRKWIKFRGVGEDENSDPDKDKGPEGKKPPQAKKSPIGTDEGVFPKHMRDPNDDKDRKEKAEKEAEVTNDKQEKIKELLDFMDALGVRDQFCMIAIQNEFFGRAHLFHEIAGNDGSTPQGAEELMTELGNGRGRISRAKVGPKLPLTAVRPVEAIWTYPTTYNAQNPLRKDWYRPQVWYTMGQQVHVSRMPVFIGHPVPDLLKPAYAFGGISLSQLAQSYVNIWLETRQSIGRLIHSFSTMVLSTDLQTLLQDPNMGAAGLMSRAQLFNQTRDNQGLFLLNKATEEFTNVSAPLSGLHELQAQSQEHMCSVSRIPAVKFTGLTPTGLNASSEGEIRVFEDTIHAYQERLFRRELLFTVRLCMLSLWGEVDEDIVFDFVPLRELTEKEEAELRKLEAETDDILVNGCAAITPAEVRKRVATDPEAPYGDIDPDDVPEPPEPEVPPGGGPGGEGGGNPDGMPGQKINIKGTAPFGGGGDHALDRMIDGWAKDEAPKKQAADDTGMRPKSEVGYRKAATDATRCARCKMFVASDDPDAPSRCTAVAGDIEPEMLCDLFEPLT